MLCKFFVDQNELCGSMLTIFDKIRPFAECAILAIGETYNNTEKINIENKCLCCCLHEGFKMKHEEFCLILTVTVSLSMPAHFSC